MAFFLKAFVTFLTVVDPIGLVPLVIALTAGMSQRDRITVVTRATLIAGGIVAFFAVFGGAVLGALGITSAAFRIAGGALLFLVAIDMLFGRQSGARQSQRESKDGAAAHDVSVFPLAIPLIAGPGTITSVILLMDDAHGRPADWLKIGVAAAITLGAAWIAMRLSLLVQQLVGTSGILVLTRVEGLLLAALSVEFILNGITRYLTGIHALAQLGFGR